MASGTREPVTILIDKNHWLTIAIALVVFFVQAPISMAHPTHVTIAQMQHNAESAALEIALQIDAHALEEALELRTGEPVDLEKTPGIDGLVHEYIADTFFVRTGGKEEYASTEQHVLSWVGFELEDEYAWLYFEVAVPAGIDGLFVANVVLFESEPTQANTINLRAGEFRTSLLSTAERPWSRIQLPEEGD